MSPAIRTWIVRGALLGGLVLALVLLARQGSEVAGPSSSVEPSGAATATVTPKASPSGSTGSTSPSRGALDPAEARAAAIAALDGFLRTSQAALADPAAVLDPVEAFATGGALGEVVAQTQEFIDLGMRITGSSDVVSTDVELVDVAGDPPSVTILRCLDDSGVTTITPEYPDGVSAQKRTANRYTVVLDGKVWKVSDHSFPANPDCS